MNSTLLSRTKTPSESSSPWSTISISKATKSTSKRPSSMVTSKRQSTSQPPEGSDIPANKVLHLRKSLYGLKQSHAASTRHLTNGSSPRVSLRPRQTPASTLADEATNSSCSRFMSTTNSSLATIGPHTTRQP
jgi:hypothetical protein